MNQRVQYPKQALTFNRARYINGSLTKKTTTDHENKPLPEEKHHFWLAFAVEKNNPETQQNMGVIFNHTRQSYAAFGAQLAAVVAQIDMWLAAPAFAWKIVDGDTNERWKNREGAAGCFVIFVKSNFPITCFDGLNKPLAREAFRLGDYVDIGVSVEINGKPGGTAGIYINPTALRWREEGPEITIGADPNAVFGAALGSGYTRALPTPQTAPASASPTGGYPGAPSHGVPPTMGQTIPAPAGMPGVAGAAPGAPAHYGAAPSPALMSPPAAATTMPTAEQIAAQYGVQHHPGWRFDPTSRQYVQDVGPTSAPPAPQQVAAPQYQQPSAMSHPAAGQPVTHMQPAGGAIGAYPSSPPVHAGGPGAPAGVPGAYPAPSGVQVPQGVQPHPGFVGG